MSHRRNSSNYSSSSVESETKNSRRGSKSEEEEEEQQQLRELILNDQDLENLICGVCHDLLKSPQIVIDRIACKDHITYDSSCHQCRPCGHAFCLKCILCMKIKRVRKCPLCRHTWTACDHIPDIELSNVVNQLRVRCKNAGCTWTGILGEYTFHSQNCEYDMVACKWCLNKILNAQMNEHMAMCPDEFLRCAQCQEYVIRGNMETHKTAVCKSRPSLCKWCGDNMPYSTLLDHESICPQQMVKCRYEPCEILSKINDLHESKCEYVPTACDKCKTQIPMKLLDTHQTHDCGECLIQCPEEKCGKQMLRKELQNHRQVCEHVVVACEIEGCTWQGKRRYVSDHLEKNLGIHLSYLAKMMKMENMQKLVAAHECSYGTVYMKTETFQGIIPVRVYPKDEKHVWVAPMMTDQAPIAVSKEYVVQEWNPMNTTRRHTCLDQALWFQLKTLDGLRLLKWNGDDFVHINDMPSLSSRLPGHLILRPEEFYKPGWKRKLEVRDVVDAEFSRGKWYIAEILRIRNSEYLVSYIYSDDDEDSQEWLPESKIDRPWSKSNGKCKNAIRVNDRHMESPIF